MNLPVTWFDAVILAIFALSGLIAYKRGLFATVFDTVSFFISFFVSLIVSRPVTVSIAGYSNFQESQIALIIQISCFFIVWYFLLLTRRFFDNLIMLVFGRIGLFYRYHRQLALLPAVISGCIVAQLLITGILIFAPPASAAQRALADSLWNKKVASRIFLVGLSRTNLPFSDVYNGYVYKLSTAPSYFAAVNRERSKLFLLPQNQYNAAIDQTVRINEAREQKGLLQIVPPPIKITLPEPLPSDTPKQKRTPNSALLAPAPVPPAVDTVVQPTLPPAPQAVQSYPTPYQSPAATAPQPTGDIAAIEREIVDLTNAERQKHGIAPLSSDDNIAAVARAHSRDMIDRGFFAHINPDGLNPATRLRLGGVQYSVAGENIAGNRAASVTVAAWMSSAPHKANILNPEYRKIGVGMAEGGPYGFMVTQNFTD